MKKILVLAGGSDQIRLIDQLRSYFPGAKVLLADYLESPVAADAADRHIRVSTLDKKAVLKLAEREEIDLVITMCTDQALPVMAYVSEQRGLPCYLTCSQAFCVTDKTVMKDTMIRSGIPTSKYLPVNDREKLEQTVNRVTSELKYPVVVKPADNNSSKGICKVTGKEGLERAIERAFSFSRTKKAIIEEFVDGQEYSVDAFLVGEIPVILMITRLEKLKSGSGCCDKFTITRCIYPAEELSDQVICEIKEIIASIRDGFRLNNVPLLLQILVKGDRVNVVEFSARTGGGSKAFMLERLAGVPVAENLIDITLGKTPSLPVKQEKIWASMNYVYTVPGIFSGIRGAEQLEKNKIIDHYFLYKTFGSRIASSESSSDRPMAFFCTGRSREELNEKIAEADKRLKILDENGQDIMIHGIYGEEGAQ